MVGTIIAAVVLVVISFVDGAQLKNISDVAAIDDPAALGAIYDQQADRELTTPDGETFVLGDIFEKDAFMAITSQIEDENGKLVGFDTELAEAVFGNLGYKVVFQEIEWESKYTDLNSDTIDCVWNGFTMNGREDKYTWTEAYLDNEQVFVVRKDSGIKTTADLAGKVVDVQKDSSAEAALNDKPELKNTFKSVNPIADYNAAFMELESGATDAIAMDSVVANYQIEQRKADFVTLEETIASEEYGVGFYKGNTELRDKVQKASEEMVADGTMQTISIKWFGSDITTIGK
jgi:polar amino acid transport system substrate-binding protein